MPRLKDRTITEQAGRWLREQRLQRGLTLKGLAAATGMTYQQVQKYETGTNRLSVERLVSFCGVLEVSPASLFLRLGYGLHVEHYQQVITDAAAVARRIGDEDVYHLWLALGERIARPRPRKSGNNE